MCIHLLFPKLNNICHFSDHLTNFSRSSCKLCLSVSLVTFLNTFVSSANFSTLLDMSSSKSFIYIKNSIGPNTDQCGTPLRTDFQFEISPSTITLCLLCVSHFSIQLITSLALFCSAYILRRSAKSLLIIISVITFILMTHRFTYNFHNQMHKNLFRL